MALSMCIKAQKKNEKIMLSFGVASNCLKNNCNFTTINSKISEFHHML